jgi:hypothetical protein
VGDQAICARSRRRCSHRRRPGLRVEVQGEALITCLAHECRLEKHGGFARSPEGQTTAP